jgi:hypothetical protein
MEDATVTEPPSSDGSSSTSSAFVGRMHHRMNMIPSILQPLGAVVVEQQEVVIQSDLSVQAAKDDPGDDASVVAAVAAIIDDGAAGVVDGVLGQETEDTAPPILATPPSNSGGSRKRGVATTARATTSSSKKKKEAAQCRKGARVKVTRRNLFYVLEHDEQRETLKGYGNSRNYYGRILSVSGKQGYNICFDNLPAAFQDVTIKRRILITVVKDGEEEKEHDHVKQLAAEDLAEITQKPAHKELPEKESINKFCFLETDTLSSAKKFDLRCGPGDDEVINWKILADNEHITEDPLDVPNSVDYVSADEDNELSDDTDHNDLFFEQCFPSVVGHAKIIEKIIDEFHADHRSPFHSTVTNDKIKFKDPEAEDPDWQVKQAYTLLIAAASEIENGVENLWKRGPSGG